MPRSKLSVLIGMMRERNVDFHDIVEALLDVMRKDCGQLNVTALVQALIDNGLGLKEIVRLLCRNVIDQKPLKLITVANDTIGKVHMTDDPDGVMVTVVEFFDAARRVFSNYTIILTIAEYYKEGSNDYQAQAETINNVFGLEELSVEADPE